MSKIRVAVVGLGFGRYGLVPAFRLDPRCEVVALCGTSRERAEEAARKLGVQSAYGDFREMIGREDFDAVAVATPPDAQPEIVEMALARSKAVFTEKPLALSFESARRLHEAAERAGVANVVDFIFPELDAWRRARQLIEEGTLGTIRHASVQWLMESYDNRHGVESWKTDPARGGGALQHFGSHVLYYLEWFLGPVSELRATLDRARDIQRPGDTHATLAARFQSGASSSVVLSSAALLGSGHRVEFYGSDGAAALKNETGDHVRGFRLFAGSRGAGRLSEVACEQDSSPAGADARVGPVSNLARRFLDWIETGKPTAPSFREGLRVQTLLDAARRSDESGQAIIIPS